MNSSSSIISTDYFIVPAHVYARETASRFASKYWWIPFVSTLVPICYGMTVDWRWLIVAGAIIFIAIPTVMMFAWICLLAQPGICEAAFPTTIFYDPETSKIRLSYNHLPSKEEDKLPDENRKTESEDIKDKISRLPAPYTCCAKDIITCDEWNNHIRLMFRPGLPLKQLLIPISAFHTQSEANIFFANIKGKIQ